jgi:hypothetical protein
MDAPVANRIVFEEWFKEFVDLMKKEWPNSIPNLEDTLDKAAFKQSYYDEGATPQEALDDEKYYGG